MSVCTTDILSVASMSYSAPVPAPVPVLLGRVAALPNGRSQRGFAARSAPTSAATDKMSVVQRAGFSRPDCGIAAFARCDGQDVRRTKKSHYWLADELAGTTNEFISAWFPVPATEGTRGG